MLNTWHLLLLLYHYYYYHLFPTPPPPPPSHIFLTTNRIIKQKGEHQQQQGHFTSSFIPLPPQTRVPPKRRTSEGSRVQYTHSLSIREK